MVGTGNRIRKLSPRGRLLKTKAAQTRPKAVAFWRLVRGQRWHEMLWVAEPRSPRTGDGFPHNPRQRPLDLSDASEHPAAAGAEARLHRCLRPAKGSSCSSKWIKLLVFWPKLIKTKMVWENILVSALFPVSLLAPLCHLKIKFLLTIFHKSGGKLKESAPKILGKSSMLRQNRSKRLPFLKGLNIHCDGLFWEIEETVVSGPRNSLGIIRSKLCGWWSFLLFHPA